MFNTFKSNYLSFSHTPWESPVLYLVGIVSGAWLSLSFEISFDTFVEYSLYQSFSLTNGKYLV